MQTDITAVKPPRGFFFLEGVALDGRAALLAVGFLIRQSWHNPVAEA
jgi:hypothetical protein